MSGFSAIHGIVVRDLVRAFRQRGRLIGGLVRPFMWLVLVGSGYNAIARIEGVASYRAFVFPGIIVMATMFGAMLTAISTVYDREFGMLRLMLAGPAGIAAVLAARMIAATIIGTVQGAVVLLFLPLVAPVSLGQWMASLAAVALGAAASGAVGLLVAAPLQSVENFAAVINVVLFPLLFLSGALYPTLGMPAVLRQLAQVNPVSYAVDLLRATLGQPAEFGALRSALALLGTMVIASGLTALIFEPERRFMFRHRPAGP
jgi:ABC-2 type transport system permease protein